MSLQASAAFVLLLASVAIAELACVSDEEGACYVPEALNLIQRQGQYRIKSPEPIPIDGKVEKTNEKSQTTKSDGNAFVTVRTNATTYDSRTGIIGCILAFITYGCFLACPKLVKPTTSGVAFQFYVGIGLLFSTLVALPLLGERLVVTFLSLVSGMILVVCLIFTLLSIWTIGLTWFSQIQPPLAAIVGFLFAHYVLQSTATSMTLACTGLAMMVLGIVIANNLIYGHISWCQHLDELKNPQSVVPQSSASPNLVLGFIEAIVAGIVGGLIFAPSRFAAAEFENASFCLGISVAFFVCCTAAFILCALRDRLTQNALAGSPKMMVLGRLDIKESLPVGLLQGLLLGLANIFTLYGCFSPIGVGVTTAVRNSAGCATVLWGAFVFKEYGDLDFCFKAKLLLAIALVIPGVILLLDYGD